MNWLKRRLRDWLRSGEINLGSKINGGTAHQLGGTQLLECDPMRINIYRAVGGTVIQTSTYDKSTDRGHTRLHIVTDDQDLGKSISQIIIMETLRAS